MIDSAGIETKADIASSDAVPARRKRGRPRKVPVPADSAGTGGVTFRDAVAISAGPSGGAARPPCDERPGLVLHVPPGYEGPAGPAGTAIKRKRGRPRKNPVTEQCVSAGPAGPQALEPIRGTGVVGRVLAPAKRGPGRPRKNPPAAAPAAAVLQTGPAPVTAGPAGAPFAEPVKRRRGRPRKHPAAVRAEPASVRETAARVLGDGAGLVDRFGIGPGNSEGIGFWPPKPEEIESVKIAARSAGVASGRRRGRRPKVRDSADTAPERPIARSSFGADVEGKPFCGKCGTYTRIIQPENGPPRRTCPKCHPEKMPQRKSPLDRTGMPCKDRGVCRPERCVMAFDCEEMKRAR